MLFLACEKKDKHGCLDSQACNYDSDATIDNNSCIYEFDCNGYCGGVDTTCVGCDGVLNSGFTLDSCGVCDSDLTNDCIQDCNEDWGGTDFCIVYPVNGQHFSINSGCSKDITLEFNLANNDNYCLAQFGAGDEFGILDCTLPIQLDWRISVGENTLPLGGIGFIDNEGEFFPLSQEITVYLETEIPLESTSYAIFADQHWSLYNWITHTILLQDMLYDSLQSMVYVFK